MRRRLFSVRLSESFDWDEKSDIWAVGCMLFELYTGVLLFQTHDSYQHIALIVKRLGRRIPYRLIEKCDKKSFFEDTVVYSQDNERDSDHLRSVEETLDTKVM